MRWPPARTPRAPPGSRRCRRPSRRSRATSASPRTRSPRCSPSTAACSSRPAEWPMPAEQRQALEVVAAFLRCPGCAGQVLTGDGQVRCDLGHSFNIARQGYVSLTGGRGGPGTGDSAAMVMARERFLGGGHYRPLADAIAGLAARLDHGGPGLVLDLAGGTGYYLARVLDELRERHGAGVDLSAPALRRAAGAPPRAAALGADAWERLPFADDSAALVLSVFG